MLTAVVNAMTAGAEELGFSRNDLIQEWLWDEDVDNDLRAAISQICGADPVNEDYDGEVDGAIIWWRDGDDEEALADDIMDATATLSEDAPFWILTPKPGREGSAAATTVQNAARTAGMTTARPISVSANWNAIRLKAFGTARQHRS